jgi:hypothetical protein
VSSLGQSDLAGRQVRVAGAHGSIGSTLALARAKPREVVARDQITVKRVVDELADSGLNVGVLRPRDAQAAIPPGRPSRMAGPSPSVLSAVPWP